MTTRLSLALLVLVLLVSSSAPVVAGDEPPTAEPAASWIYDIRVVKVSGARELAEMPAPWAEAGGGSPIVEAGWSELFGKLQERGQTTILLDQRVTTMDGVPATAERSQARQVRIFDRADQNNSSWKASLLNTGCSVKLLPDTHLDYELNVMWLMTQSGEFQPLHATTKWKGRTVHYPGATLVLSHREQVQPQDGLVTTQEIWSFITERRFPPK